MFRNSVLGAVLFLTLCLFLGDTAARSGPGRQESLALRAGSVAPDNAPVALSATDDALARASAALTALLGLAQSPTFPTSAQLQAVLNQFNSALALDSRIANGNFGWALTRVLLLAADFEERFGQALTTTAWQGMTHERAFAWSPLDELTNLKGILSPRATSSLGMSLLAAQLPAGQVSAIQSYLIATALPALEAAKDHLDAALLDTAPGHIPFAVRNTTGTVIYLIDRGDLYLAKGSASVMTAAVYFTVVYHLDPGAFDAAAVLGCCSGIYTDGVLTRQEYLPPSPFMTRYAQNYWGAMLASLGEAAPAAQAGIMASNHTRGTLDPVNPNDPTTAESFVKIAQYAAILQLALQGPVQVPVSTPTGPALVRVNITAWNTRLPADLKALFPTFTASWQIVSLPDTTFAGLFPDGNYPLAGLNHGLVGFLEGVFGVPLGESVPELYPPVVYIWSPWEGAFLRGAVLVRGIAYDDRCLQNVRVYVGGALAATLPACLTSFEFNWSWNTASVADGTRQLRIAATDKASPAHTTSSTVNVVVDNTPPTVTLTSPTAGSILRGVVRVSATAADNLGLERVEFRADTRALYTDTMAPFEFDWDTRTLPDGPLTLVARAVDRAGGMRQSTVSVNVDNLLFDDVPVGSFCLPYATAVFNAGVTTGCYYNPATGQRRFCPDDMVTRAQMAAFLCRALGLPQYLPATATFADVPIGNIFRGYVERIFLVGITTGCAAGPLRYCPGDTVTRGQMAAFLCRALGLLQYLPATATFADVPIGNIFRGYVERIYLVGITTGCATGPLRYCPGDAVTRDQMAVFLVRAFNLPLP
jgi:hypothetical protein